MLIFPTYQTMLAKAAATSSGGGVVTSDLVLHLDANNYSGSGDWLDETTNNHDGTIDGATYVAASGSDGAYFDFDGSNDHIDFATSSDFAFGTGDYSIGFWFYTTSTKSVQAIIDTRYNSSVNGWSNYLQGSANTYRTWGDTSAGGGGNWFTSNTTYSTNTWYHVVAVRDGTTFNFYTNGTADSNTDTNSFDYEANDFMLGWNYSTQTNRSFEGRIAHVTVYKGKALSASEVTQNYNALKSRFGY